MALAAGEGQAAWLPNTCTQTMVSASHWVGLTLPGMIDEPGSFSGSASSPRPERGPEPSRRMSLAILNSAAAAALIAPWREHHGVVRGQRLELVGRGDERQAGDRGDPLGHHLGEADRRVEAGADRGAALRQLHQAAAASARCARSPLATCAA